MNDKQIFDSTVEGKRRSVLFGLALTTALINLVAATTTFLAPNANISVVVVLLALGAVFIGFALVVYTGRMSGLVADGQLFWRVMEVKE